MTDPLQEKIDEWLKWDKNERTLKEIQNLKNEGKTERLGELLLSRIEFGTAGLRAAMGAGFSQMNDLVIIQTAQGLLKYLDEQKKSHANLNGIVVGYDGRHNSKRFADLTASIFLNKDIKVYMYSKPCPTPFIPFAVIHFKCICGIMVTASHNPKEDNGYKVYYNGTQILSPHDKNIQQSILNNLVPWEKSWDISVVNYSNSKLLDPLPTIEQKYFSIITSNTLFPELNEKSKIKFTYSAMHGVGYPYVVKAFHAARLKPFIPVREQQEIDPEFPTVKFPNPEEGKSALNLSFQTANIVGSTVILANDPDADRLGVAEKKKNGEWHLFTGNELGALLGWWALFCHQKKNPSTPMKNVYMISSTVSSKILQSMAEIEGFSYIETLTGFKWMGNKSLELLNAGKTVLFAFEEAIGFMYGTAVLDKDGISAAVQVASLVTNLESCNKTLQEKLQDIYLKYGQHLSINSYYRCNDARIINNIFTRLSSFKGKEKTYPDNIMGGKYKITGVRDLRNGFDSNEPDLTAKLPVSPSCYHLTFTFDNKLVVTLRTSGTEPKIKYYTELRSAPGVKNRDTLWSVLKEMVQHIVTEFLQPDKNNLVPPQE